MHSRARLARFAAVASAVVLAATLATFNPSVALAGTATGSLNVSASIANNCTVGASTMAFGAYDPIFAQLSSPLTVTGTLNLACTKNDSTTISLDTGLNGTHAVGTTRAMKDGATDYLSYELYTTSARTTVWNGTNTVAYTGAGTSGAVSVYGSIPAGQSAAQPAGTYTDTVGISVVF